MQKQPHAHVRRRQRGNRNAVEDDERPAPPAWRLPYASHLGFRSWDRPLFAESAARDPVAQIAFAAGLGLAGVQDAWAASREPGERRRIAAALAAEGLSAGCVVCGSRATIREPRWVTSGRSAREAIRTDLDAAMSAALEMGATRVVVIGGGSGEPQDRQAGIFMENLVRAAQAAAANGLVLCLEALDPAAAPGMFPALYDDAAAIVRGIDHPSVRLVHDTAHLAGTQGDVLGRLERDRDIIGVIQIANWPGRQEPEHGTIDMAAVLRSVASSAYDGLVELEHLWREPSIDAERRGIEWLRRADAEVPRPGTGFGEGDERAT